MYRRISSEKHLTTKVVTQVRNLIRSQKLKPGQKLPNELELSELFGVSRPTVREAIKILVSQNVVEISRGRGTFVSATPGVMEDPFGLDFVQGADIQEALIEARLIVEPGAARLAAKNADDEDIACITGHVHDMESVVHRHGVGMSNELEFHRCIARATKNPVILRIVPLIMDSIVKTYTDAPRTSEDHEQALAEHAEVLAAISSREPEKAYNAMKNHLEASYKRTLSKKSGAAE